MCSDIWRDFRCIRRILARRLVSMPELARWTTLVVDATGVGNPAVDLLRQAKLPCPLVPVTMQFRCEVWNVLRHLQRVPLHTPYPDVVELVRRLVSMPDLARWTTLVVDATGVGNPVVDLLRQAKLPCSLVPVTISSGDRESSDARGYSVPKRDLIVGLQVAFQKRWIRMAGRTKELEAFRKELMDIRLHVSEQTGYERYAAPGHDDLALAAALAWWRLRRSWPNAMG